MELRELSCDINLSNFGCIPAEVDAYAREHAQNFTMYCTWLDIRFFSETIVFRIFAYRKHKGKKLELTEVSRRTPGVKGETYKNIYLTAMSGYHVTYRPEEHYSWYGYSYCAASDYNKWWNDGTKRMGLFAKVINPEAIFRTERYKFCGYPLDKNGDWDLLDYLELYDKHPEVEYFGKLGLKPRTTLISAAKKDKQLIRFLKDNVEKCNLYGPQITLFAYKNKMSFYDAEDYLQEKRLVERGTARLYGIQRTNINRFKLYDYIKRPEVGFWNYSDYWDAINGLGLDLNDTKNVFPKDFRRMHDLRVNEYASIKAAADLEKKKDLDNALNKVSQKYKAFEIDGQKYVIRIAEHISDLINEGEKLHHCVGHMGYDKKMADEKSIIAFVRKSGDISTPFVTVEYIPGANSYQQCYADHDSRPDDEVLKFVEKWCKKTSRELKKAVNV